MSGTTPNPQNVTKRSRRWLWLLIAVAAACVDQLSKWLCIAYLKAVGSVSIIPGLLKFTYLENTGAAFGSFSDQRWVFMVFSTVAIVGVTVYLLRFAENNRLLLCALALIIGGGIGNMIDRVALGYVVDFIDFYVIWPYIFNIADCCVCIGAGLMVLYCIIVMREEMKQSKSKQNDKESTDTDTTQPPDGGAS